MATRKTKGKRRGGKLTGRGLRTSAQRRGRRKKLTGRITKLRKTLRTVLDTAAAKKRVVKIRYDHLRNGRVRYQPIDAQPGKGLSPSYASRQGARRAARKQFKGSRVVAVVAA